MNKRLCEVMGDEIRTLEKQEDITESFTLQGTVHRYPVRIPWGTPVKLREDTTPQRIDSFLDLSVELRKLWCRKCGCALIIGPLCFLCFVTTV